MFKNTFLFRFFPQEAREAKLQEFMNLKQGSTSVKKYSLNLTLLSKYESSMVAS